jgi:hypothetical protein
VARIENEAEGFVVVYAVTGWKYFTLTKGDNTSRFSDPDNFCVYEEKGRNLVNVLFNNESAEIWRLHDACRVIVKKNGAGGVTVETLTMSLMYPHRCVGSWSRECHKDKSLTRTSVGLNYPPALSSGVDTSKSQEIKFP